MTFLIILLVILFLSWLFGEIFQRFQQPAIVGQLLAGIVLGPTLLNFVDPLALGAADPVKISLELITMLAVFFIVFFAGLEMNIEDVMKVLKGRGQCISIGSFMVTFLLGCIVGYGFLRSISGAMFIGLCISITALPVSVKMLIDLNKLHTKTGHAIVGTAIVHDIIALSGMAVLIGFQASRSPDMFSMVTMLVRIALFIALVFTIERALRIKHGLPAIYLTSHLRKMRSRGAQVSIGIIVALGFAGLAELVGISYVVGAFYGGLIFSKNLVGDGNYSKMTDSTVNITMGFFAPIFMVYIGLCFNARELLPILPLFMVILMTAMAGMFVSGYLGSRMAGYTNEESLVIGTGINARGMMEMVIALLGLKYGFIGVGFFSVLVALAFITTIITPSLLKHLYKKIPEEGHQKGLMSDKWKNLQDLEPFNRHKNGGDGGNGADGKAQDSERVARE